MLIYAGPAILNLTCVQSSTKFEVEGSALTARPYTGARLYCSWKLQWAQAMKQGAHMPDYEPYNTDLLARKEHYKRRLQTTILETYISFSLWLNNSNHEILHFELPVYSSKHMVLNLKSRERNLSLCVSLPRLSKWNLPWEKCSWNAFSTLFKLGGSTASITLGNPEMN